MTHCHLSALERRSRCCAVPQINDDLRVVRASAELADQLSTELGDVTSGHVVPGHVLAADLRAGDHVRLSTVADSPRNIWLSKYDVPHRQVPIRSTFSTV